MCGIVACIGSLNPPKIVLQGLKMLEYRGYDSWGIASLQLFAYYVAGKRGCDIDKPRNLAKSITVE